MGLGDESTVNFSPELGHQIKGICLIGDSESFRGSYRSTKEDCFCFGDNFDSVAEAGRWGCSESLKFVHIETIKIYSANVICLIFF